MGKIAKATAEADERDGTPYTPHPGQHVVEQMLEARRPGRLRGAGFYDYDESGKRGSIWSCLSALIPLAEAQIPFQDIKDRLLFAPADDTPMTFEDGTITTYVDATHRAFK